MSNLQIMVEIKQNFDKPRIIEGIAKGSGRPYRIVKQTAFVHNISAYPVEMEMNLRDEKDAYGVGTYEVDFLASCYVDNNKNLTLGRLQLMRTAVAKTA